MNETSATQQTISSRSSACSTNSKKKNTVRTCLQPSSKPRTSPERACGRRTQTRGWLRRSSPYPPLPAPSGRPRHPRRSRMSPQAEIRAPSPPTTIIRLARAAEHEKEKDDDINNNKINITKSRYHDTRWDRSTQRKGARTGGRSPCWW